MNLKNKQLRFVFSMIAWIAWSVLSCAATPEEEAAMPVLPVGECIDGTVFNFESKNSDFVFDQTRFETFYITIEPEDWEYLKNNAREELYVPAVLTVEGCNIGQVGLRFKGGEGTLTECFNGDQLICRKLSMKIKFDKYDEDKRYHGLKRLNFHALAHDDSLMHDRLGYSIFREMGIVTSRASHASLVINGENRGVFSLVEQIDGRFTDNRFEGNGDGNLYKAVWPTSDDPEDYSWALKTNEETNEHSTIIRFFNEMSAATEAQLGDVLDRWWSAEYLMRYMVVDDAISNIDGVTAWWCGDDWGCGNDNYYIYQEETSDRFWLLPWDMDSAFETPSPLSLITPWDEPAENCTDWISVFDGDGQMLPPSCDRFFQGLALLKHNSAHYQNALKTLLDGPFNLNQLNAKLDTWSAQIESAVKTDPHGPPYGQWRAAVSALKGNLETLRQQAESELQSYSNR